VPGNTPYTRYFLAHILQFQFYKALCDAAGYKGPLHECSIYGNKEAGKKYWAMLSKGAEPAVAEDHEGTHRHREDGCQCHPRLLRAVADLAEAAERR
jgi:hypothetical protein